MSENTTPAENGDGEVADLMATIRARVAERKDQGLYSLDGLTVPAGRDVEPFGMNDLLWLEELAEVAPDMALVQSTRPGVGALVGKTKAALAQATSQPLLDLAARQSQFNAAVISYITELSQETQLLRSRLAELEAELGPESRP